MRRPIAFAVLPASAAMLSASGAQAGSVSGRQPTVVVAQSPGATRTIAGWAGQSFVADGTRP